MTPFSEIENLNDSDKILYKPAIFKDKEVQSLFERDGYVVIDFISPDEASHIAEKFYELHPELPKGFYSAALSSDDTFKQEIFDHTKKVFDSAVSRIFTDYKVLGSTFLCKSPGEEGKVGVHQDWSVVDESKFYSATIWVPTIDTSEQNGALRVLPGSHLFFDFLRSPNIPFCYHDNEQLLLDNMKTVPMKAGQAFILNHAVIHASPPNKTDKERLVIAYGLIPKDAKLIFFHRNSNGKIEKFNMPDDFFQRYYNVGERPLFGDLIKEFEYLPPFSSRTELAYLIQLEKQKRKEGINA